MMSSGILIERPNLSISGSSSAGSYPDNSRSSSILATAASLSSSTLALISDSNSDGSTPSSSSAFAALKAMFVSSLTYTLGIL